MSKLVIEVSKRNFNRHMYGTHSLLKVLELEGHQFIWHHEQVCVLHLDKPCWIGDVELSKRPKAKFVFKPRPEPKPAVEPEPTVEPEQAVSATA